MKITSLVIFIFILFDVSAQTIPAKVKIKKQDSEFYFFQLGKSNDTISKNKNDLFYLQIPQAKRCTYKIEIQNGQLLKTKSDTVFKLVKLNNLNYIHYYSDSLIPFGGGIQFRKCFKYNYKIDGANNLNNPNIIQIRFVNSFNDSTILVNKFYYK
jgi:hypothetical protein